MKFKASFKGNHDPFLLILLVPAHHKLCILGLNVRILRFLTTWQILSVFLPNNVLWYCYCFSRHNGTVHDWRHWYCHRSKHCGKKVFLKLIPNQFSGAFIHIFPSYSFCSWSKNPSPFIIAKNWFRYSSDVIGHWKPNRRSTCDV